jgi:hypothetical protein
MTYNCLIHNSSVPISCSGFLHPGVVKYYRKSIGSDSIEQVTNG